MPIQSSPSTDRSFKNSDAAGLVASQLAVQHRLRRVERLRTPSQFGRSMTKYLLTCECGKTVTVDIGQAGEQVACQCGAKLDVPPLRKLRHLPAA